VGYPVLLALRYLRSKKRSFVSLGTVLSTLGVAVGVAALLIGMSVTGGFKEQFRDKVLGVNAHVLVLKYSNDFREYRDIMKKVKDVPGITGVAPFIINPMMVTHGDRTATGVLLKGVDPDLLPTVLDLPRYITEGSIVGLRKPGSKPPERAGISPIFSDDKKPKGSVFDIPGAAGTATANTASKGVPEEAPAPAVKAPAAQDLTPAGGFESQLPTDDELPEFVDPDPCKSNRPDVVLPGLVVGKTLAKQLQVKLGDCVQITSPMIGMSYGSGGKSPVAKQFRVIAVFEAGFDQYDSKLVYTDLYEAEAFYAQGDSVTGVEMKVANIDDASKIARNIDKLLANGIYHSMDWHELNRGLFTALLIQQIGISFLLAMIIVVAAFTVVATLVMVVLEKRKEVALLKALGATDSAILRVFLYQGGLTGITGTALGLAIGFLGCKVLARYPLPLDPKVYFISHLPVNIRPTEFVVTGGVSLVICLLATVAPALYAAWLKPTDGLRAD
jgi:lipoprotein-releasing system permease protein